MCCLPWCHRNHQFETSNFPQQTQNHLSYWLTQKVSTLLPLPGDFKESDLHRQQWRQVQHLADTFWRRWKQEYQSTLQSQSKWQEKGQNMNKGDVVLLKDSQAKVFHVDIPFDLSSLHSGIQLMSGVSWHLFIYRLCMAHIMWPSVSYSLAPPCGSLLYETVIKVCVFLLISSHHMISRLEVNWKVKCSVQNILHADRKLYSSFLLRCALGSICL